MEKFDLKKLWYLRKELDDAILQKKYHILKQVKNKYKNLVDNSRNFNHAFICYHHAFYTTSARDSHCYQNVISIYKNIEDYEQKFVGGNAVSTKLKTPSNNPFLAGEIWVLRAMYDKFLFESNNCHEEWQIQQNMILGKAILDRLYAIIKMDENTHYVDSIREIIKEVRESYESIYGKQQPRIDFYSLTDEYLDR